MSMIVHLIHWEGRGKWVFLLPILISVLLFIVFDILNFDTYYIRTTTLFISSAILYYIGYERETIIEGVSEKSYRILRKNDTFMWLHIRYWAIVLAIASTISFLFDLSNQ